jgi:hypothetical protein
MKRLKILFFTVDLKDNLQKEPLYFIQELIKIPELDIRICYQSGNIHDILKELDFSPDFIFIDEIEYFRKKQGFIQGLKEVNIPSGILIHDLHRDNEIHSKYVIENDINLVFTYYRDAFLRFYPELADRMVWFPKHINPYIFKDYQLPKEINYLMMGATYKKFYPLRSYILRKMVNQPGFVYHGHPGYRDFTEEEMEKLYIGEKYAKEINRAKIFFTCDLILKYPISKYFEVLACNTLLLATGSQELRDLGFIDGETFVEITRQNFLQKARYYLEHEEERLEIAKRGFDMVHQNYRTEQRAKDFVKTIKSYLQWSEVQ